MKCENCGKPNSFMVLFSDHNRILCIECKEVEQN